MAVRGQGISEAGSPNQKANFEKEKVQEMAKESRGGSKPHILVLQGPNLNQVGRGRDPAVYGHISFEDFERCLDAFAASRGVRITHLQSNIEGELIDALQQAAAKGVTGAIVNPGGLTHYSVSLADAISDAPFPAIEVHLSNIHARAGRERSVTGAACAGVFMGLGYLTYIAALDALIAILSSPGGSKRSAEAIEAALNR